MIHMTRLNGNKSAMKRRYVCLIALLFIPYLGWTQNVQTFAISLGIFLDGNTPPAALTRNDYVWEARVLELSGCVLDKTARGAAEAWMTDSRFQFNIQMFKNECPPGAKNGNTLVVNVTINKPGSLYHGLSGTFTIILGTSSIVAFTQPGKGGPGKIEGLNIKSPSPSISVSGQTFCFGETGKTVTATIANAPAGSTVEWGLPEITTATGGTATSVTGNIAATLAAGTYSQKATLKDAGGTVIATSENNYTVKVNALPTVKINSNDEVCVGTALSLSATGATNYTWAPALTGGKYTPVAGDAPSKEFSVEGTDANMCKSTAKKTVAINPLPVLANLSASKLDACKGATIDLTCPNPTGGTAPFTYAWTGGTTSNVQNPTGVTVANAGKNDYTVTVEDGKKCTAKKSITVTGHEVTNVLATASAVPGTGGSSQLGVTATFNPAATAGTPGYSWTPTADITGSPTIQNPVTKTFNPGDPAVNYTVKVEDGHGCSAQGTVSIGPGALPELVVGTPTGGGSYCEGGAAIALGITPSGGTGAGTYDYLWEPSAGLVLSSNTAQNPTVTVGAGATLPGTYTATVTATDDAGTSKTSAAITVVITALPTVTITSPNADDTITRGESVNLVATAVPNTATYTWMPGNLNGANQTVSPTGTTTYSVTATQNGCTSAPKTVKVTVEAPGPDLALTPETPVNACMGEAVPLLTASASGGKGVYTFTWGPAPAGVTLGVQTDNAGNSQISIVNGAALAAGQYKIPVSVNDGKTTKTGEVVVNVDMCTCPGRLTMAVAAQTPCASPTATNTITVTGSSADGSTLLYSFVLKNALGAVVASKTDDAGPSWDFPIAYGQQGIYRLEEFKVRTAPGAPSCDGTITKGDVEVKFLPVPTVSAGLDKNLCGLDSITLKGTGTAGVGYVWDNGVTDGVAFPPVLGTTTYTVTGTDANLCSSTDQVVVTVNQKPNVTAAGTPTDICRGNTVMLTPGGDPGLTYRWDNGGQTGVPVAPAVSIRYTVTGTNPMTNCSDTASVFIKVNQLPEIVSTTPANRAKRIAIGKDALFKVEALGEPLTYQWWQKDAAGTWNTMTNSSAGYPQISGAATPELKLVGVPKAWDGSGFKCVVTNPCGFVEAEFSLAVSECFDITGELAMGAGIMPDERPGDAIDGWYCIGTRISLHAKIIQEEGYDVENPRYKWYIDGEPAEKVIDTDSSTLSWVPEYWEDDIVVKVCMYSDGACEEYCTKYLRLKAKPFEDARVRIQTSVDPELSFCPGEDIDFWVAAKGAGINPVYTWYRDVFELGTGDRKTQKMTQQDTWIKVVMTPSPEVCVEGVIADTVFLKVKETVVPTLRIENNIGDTLACRGDKIGFTAVYTNAGDAPDIQWHKDIWNIGTGPFAETTLTDDDMWVECRLSPGNDVCFDGQALRDTMAIRVLDKASVTITADMTDKVPGDELVFESEVMNMMSDRRYEWFVNANLTPEDRDVYTSTVLRQGDVVVCAVSGEKICQNRVFSNEIEVYYGKASRDTSVVIYKGERISSMDLKKAGDANSMFQILEKPNDGHAVMLPFGLFSYTPSRDFVGVDVVKYKVRNLFDKDKDKYEEGYIYITVKDNDRFFVPNIITPNGDGLNDTWKLDFLADYPDHLITVYDRNGKVVFQANNYQNDWDGSGQAKGGYVAHINLVNGIYTYVIDLGDKQKTVLKSWMEIRSDMNRKRVR